MGESNNGGAIDRAAMEVGSGGCRLVVVFGFAFDGEENGPAFGTVGANAGRGDDLSSVTHGDTSGEPAILPDFDRLPLKHELAIRFGGSRDDEFGVEGEIGAAGRAGARRGAIGGDAGGEELFEFRIGDGRA